MILGRVRGWVTSSLTNMKLLIKQLNFDQEDVRSDKYNRLTDKWISKVTSLSSACNKYMVKFTSTLIEKAVTLCGAPSCEFACDEIMSIARGERTPYSDLDFPFLVKDKAHECYFERLAVTTYFLIGSLGETKLKYMNIEELESDKWFEDKSKNWCKIGRASCRERV